jgi:hypothetical protein
MLFMRFCSRNVGALKFCSTWYKTWSFSCDAWCRDRWCYY